MPCCKLGKMLITTTTTNNNNVYNLENQRHTATPLRQQLIIHWRSGHSLVDELGVDKSGVNEPGHNPIHHRIVISITKIF